MTSNSPFVSLSEIKPRKVKWFWESIIPYGMITIIEGDPGQGKSFVSMYLTSLVSTGGTLPNGCKVRKRNVLYISAEDDASYTIRPRIDAMGGNPNKVRILKTDLSFDSDGLENLRDELEEYDPAIIFIDPWVSFFPPNKKITDSAAVRALLKQISNIAKEYECAIVLIRHLTKMKQENALYQGGGTVDMIAAARSAVRIATDPQDKDVRVMVHFKHNVGPQSPSWAYRLIQDTKDDMPCVEFIGESHVSIDDLTNPYNTQKPRDIAEEFLKSELANGKVKASSIKRNAKFQEIRDRTLDRAKKKLKIKCTQEGRSWWWSLPKA